MRRTAAALTLSALLLLAACGRAPETPDPAPTAAAETPKPTPTAAPSAAPDPTPSPSPEPTPDPTPSPTPESAPTPTARPLSEGTQALLAYLDAGLQTVEGATSVPRLEYYAEGGSGPSLLVQFWTQEDKDALRALVASYDWQWQEGEPPETGYVPAPEGGAHWMRLLSSAPFGPVLEFSYGDPYVEASRGGYYTTGDHDGFYRALERFVYLRNLGDIKQMIWEDTAQALEGGTITVRTPDGGETEAAWADVAQPIRDLLDSRLWIFLPEFYSYPEREGDHLTLSAGEENQVEVYVQGGYVHVPGYGFQSVDQAGDVDSIYAELCGILGVTTG